MGTSTPTDIERGESDDYTLMSASLMNDFNFTIDSADLIYAQTLFSEWADFYKNYCELSPYYANNGD